MRRGVDNQRQGGGKSIATQFYTLQSGILNFICLEMDIKRILEKRKEENKSLL